MEPIETGTKGSQMRQMYLCPSCYLVMWSDNDGLHIRQGIPMNKGAGTDIDPQWMACEPKAC